MSNKRQKQDVHVSPRIVISNGDFTLESMMSIALLQFIISNEYTILELDNTCSNFNTLINAYKHTPNTYIVGLGGEYQPQQSAFHWSSSPPSRQQQQKKKGKGKNNNVSQIHHFNDSKRCKIVPLATVGLIYRIYGKQIIMKITGFSDSKRINWLYERTYFDFIEIIDAYTRKFNLHYVNDVSAVPQFTDELQKLPSFVKYYNVQLHDYERLNDDKEAIAKLKLERIETVVQILHDSFVNYVKYFAFSFLHGEEVLIKAYEDSLSGVTFKKYDIGDEETFKKIVVIPEFIPWKEHLFTFEKNKNILENCLYTIYLDSSHSWRLAAVPTQPSSFESRKKLPEKWCGLSGDELKKACGVNDASFVHAQGFIAGADSVEGCIKMAIKAVTIN